MQSCALEKEEHLARVQAAGFQAVLLPVDLGGLGRQQAEREPRVCPCTAVSRAIFSEPSQ